MKNVIVLIGAPATGKSTIAGMFSSEFGFKIFSFDELFLSERLSELSLNGERSSKGARAQMIKMVEECDCSWIVVDDTNHYHSMQKRYLSLSNAKIVFLYLRAESIQLRALKVRNSKRKTRVTDKDIENIVMQLNEQPPIDRNLLEFHFESLPSDICNRVIAAFGKIKITEPIDVSTVVPLNFKHELNNRLNERIHQAFQSSKKLAGKRVSQAKREFLNTIDEISLESIDDLVSQFALLNL